MRAFLVSCLVVGLLLIGGFIGSEINGCPVR
jgi:hypothetical protein